MTSHGLSPLGEQAFCGHMSCFRKEAASCCSGPFLVPRAWLHFAGVEGADRWAEHKGPGRSSVLRADFLCSVAAGQLLDGRAPSIHHQVSVLDALLSFLGLWRSHMHSLFRLQWGSFPTFAGLAPATGPGASVLHILRFLPAVSSFTFSQTFCLFSVS